MRVIVGVWIGIVVGVIADVALQVAFAWYVFFYYHPAGSSGAIVSIGLLGPRLWLAIAVCAVFGGIIAWATRPDIRGRGL